LSPAPAADVAGCVFHTLALQGVTLDRATYDTLLPLYLRTAEDAIVFYAADSDLNGLAYDRHAEEITANAFVRSVRAASADYLADPLGPPLIPNWNRVDSALPDFFAEFRDAVHLDNA